jgi:hypothetical protein
MVPARQWSGAADNRMFVAANKVIEIADGRGCARSSHPAWFTSMFAYPVVMFEFYPRPSAVPKLFLL